MTLRWVDICATKIRSMLNLLPFASASCACLLRAPKRRPPVEVRDVRELRDFAYRLVHPGGRYLCAGLGLGLGLGGVLVFCFFVVFGYYGYRGPQAQAPASNQPGPRWAGIIISVPQTQQ